jgi:hypothetical protein
VSKVEIRRVTPDDAALLASLENQVPPTMRFGESGLRERLERLETNGNSLSCLAEAKGAALGCLLAWTDRSLIDMPRPPRIILIDNLVVRPDQPRLLYRLLEHLAEDIAAQNLGQLSIEGVCRRRAYKVFQEHETAIARLGYEPAGTYEYWEDAIGEEVCWMRWVPLSWAQTGPPSELEGEDAWIPSAAEPAVEEPWVPVEAVGAAADGEDENAAPGEGEAAAAAPPEEDAWQPANRAQMLKIRRREER